jgi:hypothetical protein
MMMMARLPILALLALAPLGAQGAEQTFTRTINLRDQLNLAVVSGAGDIRISQGPAGRLRITGHVRANDWHATDDRLRDIAANPPIQNDRSMVRLGSAEELTHVIIDYDIEAPADSIIQASSGVGNIIDDGVGQSARFNTASGDIHATGLRGTIDASTKAGDIEVEQIGGGEVKATSGTGSLELRDLRGALRATTDAGNIKVSGAPGADWSVRTGKGDIELTLGRAACNLDAQSGDGRVHSDLAVGGPEGSDASHLVGTINGGGHHVILQTDAGQILIR